MKQLRMNGNPRRLQGGIFGLGGLFSDKKKSKTKQTIDQTQNTQRVADTTRTETAKETSKQTTSLLSQGTQDQLTGLLTMLVGQQSGDSAAAGQIGDVADILLQRAGAAEDTINARNTAILADARRSGQEEITRLKTDLATQAGGSTFNTFVAGATAQGQADLESQLAAAEGQLGNEARNTQTSELLNVINAIATGADTSMKSIAGVTQIADILRGATAVTETVGDKTATGLESTRETIDTILKQLMESVTKESSKPSMLKSLISLKGLQS